MKTPGKIEVYLYFDGNCEDALRFYEEVLGGEITYMQKWKDLRRMTPRAWTRCRT